MAARGERQVAIHRLGQRGWGRGRTAGLGRAGQAVFGIVGIGGRAVVGRIAIIVMIVFDLADFVVLGAFEQKSSYIFFGHGIQKCIPYKFSCERYLMLFRTNKFACLSRIL